LVRAFFNRNKFIASFEGSSETMTANGQEQYIILRFVLQLDENSKEEYTKVVLFAEIHKMHCITMDLLYENSPYYQQIKIPLDQTNANEERIYFDLMDEWTPENAENFKEVSARILFLRTTDKEADPKYRWETDFEQILTQSWSAQSMTDFVNPWKQFFKQVIAKI
jgi:hypothetical protein